MKAFNLRTLALILALPLAPVMSVQSAYSQTADASQCVMQADLDLKQFRSAASECGAKASDLADIDSGHSMSFTKSCSEPLALGSQASAFEECARLYYCAKQTLDCVKDTALANGYCSGDISFQCISSHPIPY